MGRIKRTLKRIFFLPPLPTAIVAMPAFALVIYVLSRQADGALAYLAYAASAYALAITVTGFSGIVQAIRQNVKEHPLAKAVLGDPFGRKLAEDVTFRAKLSLRLSFVMNLFYIVIKMTSGIYYRSVWFITLAVYYLLLALMRFLLLRQGKGEGRSAELRRYRLCGMMLLLMNQALMGIVILMVHQNRGYEYPGMLIYAMALYSFYAVTIAIVNIVKFRRHGSPVLSAAKAVNLAAALVSILSLETAMLAQFGGSDGPVFRKTMTGATGGGVCVIILEMAVFMIVKSTKCLRQTVLQNR